MFYQFNHLGSPDYLKIEKNRDFSFSPHLHQCYEVIAILEGEMRVTVDAKTFLLTPSQALLIFPNQIHSLESDSSRHILCIFSSKLVQAYHTKVADKIPQSNKFCPDPYLLNALDTLESASSIERKGILYSLCGQFDKQAEYEAKPADNKSLLYQIFSFVEERFAEDCSLSALAELVGYDYAYLSRFFKKIVGISFNTYVNQYRLSHACYLMDNTTHSIVRCAYESGYTSLRSFNRNFKAQFGITPVQYRKKYRT
ncbi:MAG: helix-turn-helix transcriptional regulator [Clostridia bacterium]|nr:helix-turn-helix transcriptional regulator [Clostridia bacterium]